MIRHEIAGTSAVRKHVGIEVDDPRVFRPVTLSEAIAAVDHVCTDAVASRFMPQARVGLVLDMIPGHRRPRASEIARQLGLKSSTVRRRELLWESCPESIRFDLVRRSIVVVLLTRAGI